MRKAGEARMREEVEAQTISGAGGKSPQGHKVFVLQKSLKL